MNRPRHGKPGGLVVPVAFLRSGLPLFVLLVAAAPALAIERLYPGGFLVPTGGSPRDLAVGDIDQDGWPDAVVVCDDGLGLAIHRGSPSGHFGAPIRSADPSSSIELRDVDHDGDLDALLFTTDAIRFRAGGGDGTFGGALVTPIDGLASRFVVGQFTADAEFDVLEYGIDGLQKFFRLYSGDGSGNFTAQPRDPLTTDDIDRTALDGADFDGDGLDDVLAAVVYFDHDYDPPVREDWYEVHFGNGTGQFSTVALGGSTYGIDAILCEDLDADGANDFVLAVGQELLARYGDGAGGFTGLMNLGSSVWDLRHLAVADMDGNGTRDLLASRRYGDPLTMLENGGGRAFTPDTTYPTPGGMLHLETADVDGDGIRDIVALTIDACLHTVYGAPGMRWSLPPSWPTPAPPTISATGDFDGDGHRDVVVGHQAPHMLSVLYGDGAGHLTNPTLVDHGHQVSHLFAADLDGDGDDELLATTEGTPNNMLWVLERQGSGAFSSASYVVGNDPRNPTAADVDGDGDLDVLVPSATDGWVRVFPGNGDGTLGAPTNVPTAAHPLTMELGDWNGDAKMDFAVGTIGAFLRPNEVMVYLGDGAGGFQKVGGFLPGMQQIALKSGDLNGDGRLDLAGVRKDGVAIHLGAGNGSFGPPTLAVAYAAPSSLELVDADGDGALDFLMTEGARIGITVHRGRGDGTLGDRRIYHASGYAHTGVFGDFDEDGWIDAATANLYESSVSVLLNLSPDATTSVPVAAEGPPTRIRAVRVQGNAIVVSLASPAQGVVELLDLAGRVVARRTLSPADGAELWIEGSSLAPGVFFARLRDGRESAARKFVFVR